jgi:addiction module RelB/DinJ family antitoxin
MDTELIRFRIDTSIRDAAAAVCADRGFELVDVLRALVTRIARDGTLPFEPSAAGGSTSAQAPFQDYDPRLWRSIKPRVEAEVALTMLARFIADCSTRIDEEGARPEPDSNLVSRLTQQREQARRLSQVLNVTDANAIAKVLAHYGPLLRKAN